LTNVGKATDRWTTDTSTSKNLNIIFNIKYFSQFFLNIMKDTLTSLQKTSTKQFFFRRMSMTSQTYLRRRIQRFARNFVF
jgi:hypothetical protein